MIVLIRKQEPSADIQPSLNDQPQCRLLSLPPELRNQIWQLLLVQSTLTIGGPPPHLVPGAPESARRRSRFCANVLRTCKMVHAEANAILYGENVFQAHASLLTALPSFLLLIHPRRVALSPVTCPRVARLIRRFYIHVRLDTDPRFSRRQVEESFSGVEELEVEVFQAMYGSCDFSVLALFDGVRGVGRAHVHGSVGDGKYANWLSRCMEMTPGTAPTRYTEEFVGGIKVWNAWTNGNR